METTSHIRAYCRLKPSPDGSVCSRLQLLPDERTVIARRPIKAGRVVPRAPSRSRSAPRDAHSHMDLPHTTADSSSPSSVPTRASDDEQTQGFVFDRVLHGDEATTEGVFRLAVAPMLDSALLRGVHTTLLSYGERSTDKTALLFGTRASGPSASSAWHRSSAAHMRVLPSTCCGIAQHALQHIFRAGAAVSEERRQDVSLIFLQFYGDTIIDLLDPDTVRSSTRDAGSGAGAHKTTRSTPAASASIPRGGAGGRQGPGVYLDGNGDVVVRGVVPRLCASEAEAVACVLEGLSSLQSSVHAGASSTVLRVTVRQQPTADAFDVQASCAHMHLVDVVSTQRLDDAMDAAQRGDVQTANKSLSALEQVVNALAVTHHPNHNSGVREADSSSAAAGSGASSSSAGPHVPYRHSKLTTFLKGFVGLDAATVLLAHVLPDEAHMESTLSTLGFAKRLRRVPVTAIPQTFVTAENQVRQLQRELEATRTELRLHTQLQVLQERPASTTAATSPAGSRQGTSGDKAASARAQEMARAVAMPLGTDELRDMETRVERFLSGTAATVDVQDVREMRCAFSLLRATVEARDEALAEMQDRLQQAQQHAEAQEAQWLSGALATDGAARASTTSDASADKSRRRSARRSTSTVAVTVIDKGSGAAGRNPASVSDGVARKSKFTPSVLDTSKGIGYGTSQRASVRHASAAPATNPFSAPAAAPEKSTASAKAAVGPRDKAERAPPLFPTESTHRLHPTLDSPLATTAAPTAERAAAATAVAREDPHCRTTPSPSLPTLRAARAAAGTVGATSLSLRPASAARPRSAGATAFLLSLTSARAPSASRPLSPLHLRTRPVSAQAQPTAMTVRADHTSTAAASQKRALFEAFKTTPLGAHGLHALARAQETVARAQCTCDQTQQLVRLGDALVKEKRDTAAAGPTAEGAGSRCASGRPPQPPPARLAPNNRPRSAGQGVRVDRNLTTTRLHGCLSPSPAPSSSSPPSPSTALATADLPLQLPLVAAAGLTSPPDPSIELAQAHNSVGEMPCEAQLRQQVGSMTVPQAEQYIQKLQASHDRCLAQRDLDARALEKCRLRLLQSFEVWHEQALRDPAAVTAASTRAGETIELPACADVPHSDVANAGPARKNRVHKKVAVPSTTPGSSAPPAAQAAAVTAPPAAVAAA